MYQFSQALGDTVKRARSTLGLTQSRVAEEATALLPVVQAVLTALRSQKATEIE